jgi:hypothetical protein
MKRISLLFILCAVVMTGMSQPVVTYVTANQAVQTLLGPGVQFSNATFNGISTQLGQMTGMAGTNFQIGDGVVIGCSDAQDVVPNYFGAGITPNISGDPDLLNVANSVPPLIGQAFSVSSVNNIASLEFDFIAIGDSLQFNYIFGSDEYLTWVNSTYNDVFAFFLSGPGITGPYAAPAAFPGGAVNIAIVPESTPPLPITISSVNNVLNSAYYIDNPGQVAAPIQLNGFTTKITAAYDLTCGETYHIRLAIANGSDQALKSDVIIEAGSFTTGTNDAGVSSVVVNPAPNLPPNSILEGCVNGQVNFTMPSCLEPGDTIQLIFGGTATYGVDYTTNGVTQIIVGQTTSIDIIPLPDNEVEPTETIIISGQFMCDGMCDSVSVSTQVDLLDYQGMAVPQTDDFLICPGTSNTVNILASGGYPPYNYSWSNNQNGSIQNFAQGSAGTYTYTVTDYCQGTQTDSFVISEPAPISFAGPQDLCAFDPSEVLVQGGLQPYTYITSSTLILDPLTNIITGTTNEIVDVTITDACNQSAVIPFIVVVCDTKEPNIMIINNDGLNEAFIVEGIESFPNSKVEVYNRWGTLVYESSNYDNTNPWKAEGLEDGVFYWILMRSDGVSRDGYVHVMRK